ncbi:multiple epidermal growth factor-like domains protein 6, partial [Biomphalaria pfeifferi]
LLYDLKMAYIYLNSETAVATSNERFIVRQNIVDIHISVKDYIRYIIFEGQAIQGFCSVWVIAGQNVAIKQNVYYSNSSINDIDTNLPHYPQATDGVYTCNENDTGLASNYWEIVMSPSFALKYLFFYTNDVLGVFRNYTIQRFNNDGEIYAVFSSQKIQSSTSYSIVTVSNTPIKAITFSVTNWSTNKTRPLLLCEVELNAECSEGTWGVHCIKTCNKSCPDLCRFDDGLCNDGCFGFSDPPKCTRACSSGSWGVNCTNRCSNSCLELSCDSKTGFCDRGCNATNCTLIPKTSEGFSKETIITIAVSIASAVVLLIILISLMVSKVKGKLCFQRKQNVRDLPQPPVEQKDEDPYDIISKLEHEDYNSIDDNKIYNNSNAYNMPAIQSQDEQNYHLQLQGIKKENDVYSKIDDKDYEINQERNLYIDVFDPTELRASYRSVNDADDISSDLQSKGSNSTDADSYQNHIISF